VHENTNARNLVPADFGRTFDLTVMDVSFISVTKIIPALVPLLKGAGKLIVLIKPQFEVGKGEVGKGGIVREPEKHTRVITEVIGPTPKGRSDSVDHMATRGQIIRRSHSIE
jgi:23S rRNA (cytidine1920-2'-O)/16S rRNA (cytidine1409-2'-O)-methyltransferase